MLVDPLASLAATKYAETQEWRTSHSLKGSADHDARDPSAMKTASLPTSTSAATAATPLATLNDFGQALASSPTMGRLQNRSAAALAMAAPATPPRHHDLERPAMPENAKMPNAAPSVQAMARRSPRDSTCPCADIRITWPPAMPNENPALRGPRRGGLERERPQIGIH